MNKDHFISTEYPVFQKGLIFSAVVKRSQEDQEIRARGFKTIKEDAWLQKENYVVAGSVGELCEESQDAVTVEGSEQGQKLSE